MTFWIVLIWLLGAFIACEFEEFEPSFGSLLIALFWPFTLIVLIIGTIFKERD